MPRLVVVACVLIALPAAMLQAQQAQPPSSTQADASAEQLRGHAEGETQAANVSAKGWFAGSLAVGVAINVFGMAMMPVFAWNSRVIVPPGAMEAVAQKPISYQQGFRSGYAHRVHRKRRNAAALGSALGTATIAALFAGVAR